MSTFADTGLNEKLLDAVKELGFETPTPIQAKTIPHLLNSNQDVIALAQTGTGKTAAFGLPAIHMTDLRDKGTQTLVLCPTRELCLQIARDLNDYAKFTKGLGVVAVYGGASIDTQIRALRREAQIVVGTPGRTKDLINRKKLLLGNVGRVILDEADEMLTMGFKEDLEAILAETPAEKQTLLFSATMSRDIISVTKKYMTDPVELSVARMNIGAENVSHQYYMVHAKDRYEVLKRIADINPNIYGIVFCRTRRDTKEVSGKLMHDGYNADALHGELSQAQRDEVMRRFRKRKLQILVATDVAARGLDVDDLTHVINFNLPDSPEVYTHRSGRTGRAGKSGISIAIIHTRETRKIREIEHRSKVTFSREMVPTGKEICKKQLLALIDKIEKVEVNEKQIKPFLPAIYEKLESLSREELIQHFVSAEFNRFLEYYKYAKDINVQGRQRRDSRDSRDSRDRRRDSGRPRDSREKRGKKTWEERRRTPFTRMFFNIGTKNNVNPARLIGLVNEGLSRRDTEIGKIEILKKFSFVEIEEGLESKLIKSLQGKEFEGVSLVVEVTQGNPNSATLAKNKFSKKKDYSGKRDGKKKKKKHRGSDGGRRSRKKW